MKYLLDTNICIYLIKRKPIEVFYRFKSHHIHEEPFLGSSLLLALQYGNIRTDLVHGAHGKDGVFRGRFIFTCCDRAGVPLAPSRGARP